MFSRKRTIAITALTAAAALVLTACGGDGGTEPGNGGGTNDTSNGGGEGFDPNDAVTLQFAFWGNEDRANLYTEAIAAFNEEYPNITVNSEFLDFPSFWEKRQTEAAGGGLPDVMQFDYSYLRQYAQNGLLLDLDPYMGDLIDDAPLSEEILSAGVVEGTTYAIPISTNAWANFQNINLADELGVGVFEGGTWDDYIAWSQEMTDAGAGEVWAAGDFTGVIQNFEIQLRAEGTELFLEDGTPGFDEARLVEFWESGAPMRETAGIPAERVADFDPVGAMASGGVVAEMTWDNFGAGYLAQLPEQYQDLLISPPPVTVEGAQDLYLKPSMLHAAAANTDHPEASAFLIDFLINSEKVGEIFGTNRGLPASETQQAGAELEGLNAQIRDYEAGLGDRLGPTPPAPIVGFGTLEQIFRELGTEIGYGTTTPEQAATQFFSEIDVVLSNQ